ncbi:MAG: riboflavin synthase [Clostridia bacterium]|nr:riboflavin synthase [Clostridia bacterium]
MFTGIIEETGRVINAKNPLVIGVSKILEDIHIGDSIAVNGVCLTVTRYDNSSITLDVMNETYSKTNLGSLKTGSTVNIERAMAANGRFGGHIVSGHIDGTGTLTEISSDGIAKWLTITAENDILNYIVLKGSVALDGVSLTVAYIDSKCFKVSIIPHTQSETTLLSKPIGSTINIENDIIGKYIEKFMHPNNESKITLDFLRENGF